jgi:hypothetical protein
MQEPPLLGRSGRAWPCGFAPPSVVNDLIRTCGQFTLMKDVVAGMTFSSDFDARQSVELEQR